MVQKLKSSISSELMYWLLTRLCAIHIVLRQAIQKPTWPRTNLECHTLTRKGGTIFCSKPKQENAFQLITSHDIAPPPSPTTKKREQPKRPLKQRKIPNISVFTRMSWWIFCKTFRHFNTTPIERSPRCT